MAWKPQLGFLDSLVAKKLSSDDCMRKDATQSMVLSAQGQEADTLTAQPIVFSAYRQSAYTLIVQPIVFSAH